MNCFPAVLAATAGLIRWSCHFRGFCSSNWCSWEESLQNTYKTTKMLSLTTSNDKVVCLTCDCCNRQYGNTVCRSASIFTEQEVSLMGGWMETFRVLWFKNKQTKKKTVSMMEKIVRMLGRKWLDIFNLTYVPASVQLLLYFWTHWALRCFALCFAWQGGRGCIFFFFLFAVMQVKFWAQADPGRNDVSFSTSQRDMQRSLYFLSHFKVENRKKKKGREDMQKAGRNWSTNL